MTKVQPYQLQQRHQTLQSPRDLVGTSCCNKQTNKHKHHASCSSKTLHSHRDWPSNLTLLPPCPILQSRCPLPLVLPLATVSWPLPTSTTTLIRHSLCASPAVCPRSLCPQFLIHWGWPWRGHGRLRCCCSPWTPFPWFSGEVRRNAALKNKLVLFYSHYFYATNNIEWMNAYSRSLERSELCQIVGVNGKIE